MEVQNTAPINPTTTTNVDSTNSVGHDNSEKKSKGCLSTFLIILGSGVLILILLALTARFWYPPLFRVLFPQESNRVLYQEPTNRGIVESSQTEGWTKIAFDNGTLLVPFGEIVDQRYDGEYIYNFANGDLIVIIPADPGSGSTNYKMKGSCFVSYSNFQYGKSLGDHISISLMLLGKNLLLSEAGWESIPYYYENDELFVCQMGDIRNPRAENSVNLIVVPYSPNSEVEANYSQVLIFSEALKQEDIDKIVSTITFE